MSETTQERLRYEPIVEKTIPPVANGLFDSLWLYSALSTYDMARKRTPRYEAYMRRTGFSGGVVSSFYYIIDYITPHIDIIEACS